MSEVFASPHLISSVKSRAWLAVALGAVAFTAVGVIAWQALDAVTQTQVQTVAHAATQEAIEQAAHQAPPAPKEVIKVVYVPRPAPRVVPEPVVEAIPPQPPVPEAIVEAPPRVEAPILRTCVDDLRTFTKGRTIFFNIGSAEVDPGKLPQLKLLAEMAEQCDEATIRVTGHSDSSGSDLVNLALSWDRADNTIAAIEAFGFSTEAFEPLGFGARAPTAEGDDADDELNRRVEFQVLQVSEQDS